MELTMVSASWEQVVVPTSGTPRTCLSHLYARHRPTIQQDTAHARHRSTANLCDTHNHKSSEGMRGLLTNPEEGTVYGLMQFNAHWLAGCRRRGGLPLNG